MTTELIKLSVFRGRGSDLAMRVRPLHSTERDYVWLPRSQVEHVSVLVKGQMCGPDTVGITVPRWLAEERGLA